MLSKAIEIRIRYGETDAMGVVYYGNYSLYLEEGRTEWLRDIGYTYKGLEDSGIMLPVRSEERRVGKECRARRWERDNKEQRKELETGSAWVRETMLN